MNEILRRDAGRIVSESIRAVLPDEAVGGLIVTGPTDANVNNVSVALPRREI